MPTLPRTLRRIVAVLIVPAVGWLGSACNRADEPGKLLSLEQAATSVTPAPAAEISNNNISNSNNHDDLNDISTVSLASSPAWGGGHVRLNNLCPVNCPPGATKYGYVGRGWFAPRPPGANWIWLKGVKGLDHPAELVKASFSKTVHLDGAPIGPISGQICLSADDYAELVVNGHLVGTVGTITNPAMATLAQNNCTSFNIPSSFLKEGSNTITVNGQNGMALFGARTDCTYKQHPAGVMFGGALSSADDDVDDDGVPDDADSDDDDDGVSDPQDPNDDNDGILDVFDSKFTREVQTIVTGQTASGAATEYTLEADAKTVLVSASTVASAADPQTQLLTVEIYNPLGALVATSRPVSGQSLATSVPAQPGSYTVRVRNTGPTAVPHITALVRSERWL